MLHKCTDFTCPSIGQRTSKTCGCHQTDEQVLRALSADLLSALRDMMGEFEDPTITDDLRTQIGISANTIKALQKARRVIAEAAAVGVA